jgi:hypothetical protein
MNNSKLLSEIQYKLKAPKDETNDFGNYKYRSCESILKAVKPILKEYGAALTISDEIVEVGGRIYVKATATLLFDGEEAPVSVSAYAREAEVKKGMDDSQITGATSSYARKYALNGLFAIDDTKDADTNENRIESENRSKSSAGKKTPAPKKEAPASKEKKVYKCDVCGGEITNEAYALKTFEKWGKYVCPECVAKKKKAWEEAEAKKKAAEEQKAAEAELPFPLE